LALFPSAGQPSLNSIGFVPGRVVGFFVAASGSILAGHALAPLSSPRRMIRWIAFFFVALAITVFLATPESGEWLLCATLGLLPPAIRDSSFFRSTGTYVLAGIIVAPYLIWAWLGAVSAARLGAGGAVWIATRLHSG